MEVMQFALSISEKLALIVVAAASPKVPTLGFKICNAELKFI
jgi:hypothetical protein